MKTLKKTLCLVLAVVLALGVMVLPAYADKETYDAFEDKDTISAKYAEAVGTLTGLGVINGRDEKVEPQACITRAEAVTMVVRAVLGKGAATLAKADTKFADVTKSHYASQYVQYAVENGIVAGKSETEFKPDDLVTGYELARMALVAADIKTDFTSAAWQNQTGTAASKAGLLESLGHITDLNKALTREESAQLIWNTVTYLPEEAKLKVEGTQENDNDETKVDYTVTYPEETIGGKVYSLKADYNYDKDGVYHAKDFADFYGSPSVKWYNEDTGESYYEGAVSAITDFYVDHDKLTVGDIKAALGKKSTDNLNAYVYVDGAKTKTKELKDNANTENVVNVAMADYDRGAHVVIYKGLWGRGQTDYLIYVGYTYVSYNQTSTGTDEHIVTKTTTGGRVTPGGNGELPLGTPMGAKSIAIFNIADYSNWKPFNVKVHAPALTAAKIVSRNNDKRDPYFRFDSITSKPVYVSAKAIYVDKKGDVYPLYFLKSDAGTTGKYIDNSSSTVYDVWFDNAGNVIALVETTPDPAAKTYTDFGYVLEFSSTKATEHRDDMEEIDGTETDATAQVVMVNLKSGAVGIYKLDVQYDVYADAWKALGIDNNLYTGKANLTITTTVTGVIEETYGQEVLHGFVAYKQLPSGNYGMTKVEDLETVGSTDQGFYVANTFTSNGPQITVEGVDVPDKLLNADADTEIRLLNGHTHTADGSRVSSYAVEMFNGYAALKNIRVINWDECVSGEHIGKWALFCYNTKTNMIENAYVFGGYTSSAVLDENDYYVFLYRGESNIVNGTDFYFLHDGAVESIPAKQVYVNDMELNEDNYDDLLAGPTVCFVEPEDDGTLSIYTPADEEYAGCVDDTNAVKRIVRAFTTKPDGKYFGYVDVFTNSDKTTSKLTYLTDRVMIVDWTKTEKDGVKLDLSKIKVSDLLVNDVAEGDEVIVYNAYYKIPGGYGDVSTGDQRVSLIIITKHA